MGNSTTQAITIYTTARCGDCRRAKLFLKERGIEFREININESPDAEELVIEKTMVDGKCPRLT